ncbi:hypothetical protein E3N88_11264 [Mikania micrantha]|uniref:Uncharacterized protein n=1 Tax=Mikania micrantha TaxID=192012 RepID=A0A5N6LKC7_9ASTR|nr:hypothetical protein E3N88_41598 [Mikania micrantha]KAD6119993.1 hypothetical protein E3N88_11264 [Mikania micrantha]
MLDKLHSKMNDVDEDDEFRDFEEFEIYKIVFPDPQLMTVGDGEDEQTVTKSEKERSLEKLFQELDRFEDSTFAIEEDVGELQKLGLVTMISDEDQKSEENSLSVTLNSWRFDSSSSFGSCESIGDATMAIEMKENDTRSYIEEAAREKLEPSAISVSGDDQKSVQSSFSQKSNSWRSDSSSSFGSYGSMRKEKEWKRTLACKLFEERNNSSGGEEGMDSLWEAYEEDNASRKSKNRKQSMINEKKTMNKNKKSSEFKYIDELEDEDEDDDEDEFMNNGQLCCLKALKLSTGKMNLGMGKPNLVKISKALKGFGWIHHVGSKHGKKH